ncbi:MAG TPA: hypothetical protein VMV48_15580 [Gallionellaceae bacterium]|nr:hypothetical protein [Gallionellaceae bacterium]
MPVNFQRLCSFSIALLGVIINNQVQASCGSTSCSINTDWNEHGISTPGWSTDFRYSYSRADMLRSGSNKIVADPTSYPYNTRIEAEDLRTINQLVTATLDYTHDEHWGATLQLPYVMRDHTHSIGDTNPTLVTTESFTANSLGDIRVAGRYRWDSGLDNHSGMGIKLGLKLNTGRKDFSLNTGALPGEATLQPGNGSTDLILGVFWTKNTPGSAWNWFIQGSIQNSISASAQFRPGNQVNLDGGTRYAFSNTLSGLLQVNTQWNDTDTGSAAALSPLTSEASSGMKTVAITPGVSYALTPSTQLYTLVQVPVYQYVNGEQLTANYSASLGIRHHF